MTREDVKQTKEVLSRVIFKADDGTEFIAYGNCSEGTAPSEEKIAKAKAQCEEYEETSKFVFKKRFLDKALKLEGKRSCMADFLMDSGCCRCDYYLYKVESEQDITIIDSFMKSQFGSIYYTYENGESKKLKVGTTYLICLNYECECAEIITESELLRRVSITFYGEPEKKEEVKNV